MKTLEQWQKELPDYSVFHHISDVGLLGWSNVEVCWNGKWVMLQPWHHEYGISSNGREFPLWSLCCAGAIFRRKKERQREFKIESDAIRAYVIDGDESITFAGFLEKENIKSATLIVDERGGE